VPSGRDNDYVSPRTVSNWRKGTALAGLTTLQSLDLAGTRVSGLSPRAKLTNLQIRHDRGEAESPGDQKHPTSRR
jgi:hypothetical protein